MSDIENLKAAGAKIIVEIEAVEEETEGGIILPEDHTRREQDTISEGILIEVGPVAFYDMVVGDIPPPQIGNKVLFVKFAGLEIKRDEKFYRIMNDEDVYAFEEQ